MYAPDGFYRESRRLNSTDRNQSPVYSSSCKKRTKKLYRAASKTILRVFAARDSILLRGNSPSGDAADEIPYFIAVRGQSFQTRRDFRKYILDLYIGIVLCMVDGNRFTRARTLYMRVVVWARFSFIDTIKFCRLYKRETILQIDI